MGLGFADDKRWQHPLLGDFPRRRLSHPARGAHALVDYMVCGLDNFPDWQLALDSSGQLLVVVCPVC